MRKTSHRIAIAHSVNVAVLLMLALASSYLSAQVFSPTGDLITGRNGQRAVQLNNGTILITGGYAYDAGAVGSSELYDPATGIFTATGSINTARRNFGIALLDDGTVLIAGGYDNSFTTLSSAEIYDPATGVFTLTGNLSTSRADATATRLADGTVLIAGGFDNSRNPLSSAELYIPSTHSFATTGSLNVARGFTTATALIDGTVLVTGGSGVGFGSNGALSSAELYDPATSSFSQGASLNVGRFLDTATLLNGGAVLIVGGKDINGNILASAELYDPILKTFSVTGDLNTARGDHAATLLTNGTVLVEGGFACQPSNCSPSEVDMSASAEVYDPVNGTFSVVGDLTTARQVHTATLLNDGIVLVAGGWSNFNYALNSAELYDPGTFAPANLVSIDLSPLNLCLPVGTAKAMTATGTFSNSTTQTLVSTIWSSSDRTVADITNDSGSNSGMTNDSTNSGVVFGVSVGLATLNACTGLICGSTSVTVSLACSGGNTTASVTPSSMKFAASVVGVASSAQTVTVTNTGNQILSFSGIQVSGDFAATSDTCGSVPIGGACAVQVTFTPTSSGSRTGTVSFSDSAADSPQTVTLNGSGIDFGFSVNNPSATVTAGGTATYHLRINSLGARFPGSVVLKCSNVPPFATCDASPGYVMPGRDPSSVTVRVITAGANAALVPTQNTNRLVTTWLSPLASHATPPGTYSLRFVAKSGRIEHVLILTLNVQRPRSSNH